MRSFFNEVFLPPPCAVLWIKFSIFSHKPYQKRNAMKFILIFITLPLMGIGFLVKRYPNMIAGYNTMSRKEKENVDIKGLSLFMSRCLIVMGIMVAVCYYLFLRMGWPTAASFVPLFVPLISVSYMLIKQRKYDHNSTSAKKNKKSMLIASVIVAIGLLPIFYGMFPADVKIAQNRMVITGMYGTALNLEELKSITLSDTLPAITYRMNGLAVGNVRKGWFKLRDGGKCLLFLSSDEAPYIKITDKSGLQIYLNARTPEQTRKIYRKF